MYEDIKEILNKIKRPLYYEPKNNFKDDTVIGGFSKFALTQIEEITKLSLPPHLSESISKLKDDLLLYRENPSLDNYLKILESIRKIENPKVESAGEKKEVNFEAARAILTKPIQYVKGIGPKKAQLLEKLEIRTLFDLLYYFPRDYIDRSKIVPISSARVGENQTFSGKIVGVQELKKNTFSILKVTIYDGTSVITGVFFNQHFLKKSMEEHIEKRIIISGKVALNYGKWEVESPEYEFLDGNKETLHTGRIVPVYKLTSGIYPKTLRLLVKENLENYKGLFYEFIPLKILSSLGLPPRNIAIYELHFPKNFESLEKARKRIVFEEFILGQYKLNKAKSLLNSEKGISFSIKEEDLKEYEKALSFKLTSAQLRVINELIEDLKSGRPMNRLLHGDVGSGKTVVAGAALYFTVKAGFQAAFMAPTEILAEQSFNVLREILSKFGFKVELLISETKSRKKKEITQGLISGEIDVIIGTHSLIQENVAFNKLATVIVDEQHRFGVKQREALKNKGTIPHMLVMSATPIPRTVAMTRFGDLDISVIDEMPKGIRRVITKVVLDDDKNIAYEAMREEINQGGKAYVICPLIEESESLSLASSISKFEELKRIFPEFKITLLHGRMNAEEKEDAIREFSLEGNILVSTTVVEVGIDVPDASIIVVEDAQRFGLAQLHQLRGRIGRKSQKSYCFLIVDNKENANRIKILEHSDSGFVIAEKDLEQRGPGELYGEKQHGYITRSLIDLSKDVSLLEEAKKASSLILNNEETRKIFEGELAFREQFLNKFGIIETG
jgi:ATP-dependent DNA helicase RecG